MMAPPGATPHMDAVAADGVKFDMAISTSAATPISHATILTGLNPYQHGVRVMYAEDGYRLPDSVPTLSTILGDKAWQTGAFLSSFTVSSFYGFDRGFDVFDEGLAVPADEAFARMPNGFWDWPLDRNQRRSDETTDRKGWDRTVRGYLDHRNGYVEYLREPALNLLAPVAHMENRSVLRSTLIIIDHNAYHLGEFVMGRQILGAWKSDLAG